MVLITAVEDIHVATNAFRRGAVTISLKPFERVQLESFVSRAIEHRRFRLQNALYRHNLEETAPPTPRSCGRPSRNRSAATTSLLK